MKYQCDLPGYSRLVVLRTHYHTRVEDRELRLGGLDAVSSALFRLRTLCGARRVVAGLGGAVII